MKQRRSLAEILQSTSDVLFPAEMGERVVALDSMDVDGDTPLHVLAWRNDHYAVQLLIEAGSDINAVGDMGNTPLHVALMKEDERMADILLSAGATTDIRSEFNNTPQELAEKLGGEMLKLFKRHAAQQTAQRRRAERPRAL
jgi:uncharacterized protein